MQTMHLFAGIGGGLLADRILGHDPIIAVEWDRYACQVLRERAADGWFPNLQVWEGDVRLFDPSEYAGRVDCIHAGFPCQDISVVGNQAGVGEETRSGLYREVIRIARILRTKYIYLENVAAIVSNGLGTVIADLAALGYDIEWLCLRASDCGANHHRDRWWGLCTNTNGNKRGASSMGQNSRTDGWDDVGGICEVFSDTGLHGICQRRQSANVGEDVQYGSGIQCNGVSGFGIKEGEVLADADITRCEGHRNSAKRRKEEYSESGVSSWWQTEPDVGGMVDEFPDWIYEDILTNNISHYKTSHYLMGCCDEKKAGRQEVLRVLRNRDATKEIQRAIGRPISVYETAILLFELCKHAGAVDKARVFMESAEILKNELRGVWLRKETSSSPHRPGCNEQQFGKHTDLVQELPRFLAHDAEENCKGNSRKDANPDWWSIEADVGRVANGIPNRIHRLKGLGNAQVPLQAAVAFSILMDRHNA